MKKQKIWKLTKTEQRDFYIKFFQKKYDEPRFSKVMDIIFDRLKKAEDWFQKKHEEQGDLPL